MSEREPLRIESALHHLATRVPTASAEAAAGQVLAAIQGREFDCADIIVVIDGEHRVLGQITLARLLELQPGEPVRRAMHPHPPTVDRGTDQERVASMALHHGLTAVAVVDDEKRLMGVVPARALLRILRREHVEDLHKLAGIAREEVHILEAMEEPPVRRVRHRLPWLMLGLAGSALAALVVGRFEELLAAHVSVAFFVPGIVYLADAIGTQTEAITVRGLSLSHARIGQMLLGEVRTGLLLGSLLGVAAAAGVQLVLGEPPLALAVGLSVVVASGLATTIGLMLPWLLARAGRDPAYGSGPVATIIQDVLSVSVYFVVVSALLG